MIVCHHLSHGPLTAMKEASKIGVSWVNKIRNWSEVVKYDWQMLHSQYHTAATGIDESDQNQSTKAPFSH